MNDRVYRFIKQGQALRKQYESSTLDGLDFMLIGGVYCLICIVYSLIGPGILTALLIMSLVFAWTFGRESIKNAHSDDFVVVKKSVSQFKPRTKKLVVVLMLGLALSLWVFLILTGHILEPNRWPTLLVISCMPLVICRYLHTWLDFVVGFHLWFLCAIAINGELGSAIQDLPAALMIGVIPALMGILLHLDYHRMAKKVRELRYGY